jgi:AraC-like DNA-binding protein/mannose-6-phosphate isomerase-like protein (cupin superfamily)
VSAGPPGLEIQVTSQICAVSASPYDRCMSSDRMRSRNAVTFEPSLLHGAPDSLPEIDSSGYSIWTRRRPQGLGTHAHREWEIQLVVRGSVDYWIEGQELTLRAGDLFIVGPGERHSGVERVRNRVGIGWLALTEPMSRLPGLERPEARVLEEGFKAMRSRRFPASSTTLAAFGDLFNCFRADITLRVLLTRASMHRLLGAVLVDYAAHARRGGESARPSAVVERATAILRERLGAPIGIEALAHAVGVSRTVLHERFLSDIGLTPMAYWTEQRIERAKQLLSKGATSAAATKALGFATPQHFARVFKVITGETPRGWTAKNGVTDAVARKR